jgi:hypothetical protein
MLPELTAAIAVEGVHTCFRAGLRIDIGTGDNPIRGYEDIAVEEVLCRRPIAHVRFPPNCAGIRVEAAEVAIT